MKMAYRAAMSWFSRLKDGLSKTSSGISEGITDIFTKRRLDDAALEELEELLIRADVGAGVAASVVAEFGEGRFDKEISPQEVKEALASALAARLEAVATPLHITESHRPHVVLVVGVNGNGKTTTIGKLAAQFKRGSHFRGNDEGGQQADALVAEGVRLNAEASRPEQGRNIMLCAADTFRAAAVEQLQRWGERVGCEVVTGAPQADPASVAFQALEKAQAQGVDVLMIDTAGRLHNKANLMEELKKIVRVLQKLDDSAPHTVLQVLDGTTGQNALQQVGAFKELIDVNGLVVTKLDGTAKAGVVVALADRYGLPIHAIGVGESVDDLQSFHAQEYARSLVG